MVSSRVRGLLLLTIVLALGCGGTQDRHATVSLSQSEALDLAVLLANEECSSKFSMAPFDSSTSSVAFKDGRWH